ncbi:MAG: amidohydrolase [Rikenellaceae bacterium]|nr:amidohydrolase [Rikenellaceae bacterium]
MNIIIDNAVIVPMDEAQVEKLFTGTVGISGDRIVMVATDEQREKALERYSAEYGPADKVIDGTGKLVMPGLVNIHNHVPMSLMRGFADDMPLMKWLHEHVWPYESKMTREDISAGAKLGIAEMLLGGTTTFTDMYWHEAQVGAAVEEMGIRAVLSPTFTDDRFADFEADFREVYNLYGSGQCGRISLMIAPHAVYSCNEQNLVKARDLAQKHGLSLNLHVSETMDEQERVWKNFGMTPVAYLDKLGMLRPGTLAVHCVYLLEEDIELLVEKGVSVAHNPQSNMKISSGISPVSSLVEHGVNVGIGTDGPCSNNDLDMWEELRTAALLQKVATLDPVVLPAYEVLQMATVNGARALGLDDRIGVLKEGLLADLIILDIDKPHMYPRHDLIANLAYCAKASDVETVIVDGNIVVENAKLTGADLPAICRDAEARAFAILLRHGKVY